MVPDLVREHIGLSELARCFEAAAQLVIEGKVDVDLAIGWAVKWPGRLSCCTTTGRGRPRKENERRDLIGLAHLLEQPRPGVFGIRQYCSDELAAVVTRRSFLACLIAADPSRRASLTVPDSLAVGRPAI